MNNSDDMMLKSRLVICVTILMFASCNPEQRDIAPPAIAKLNSERFVLTSAIERALDFLTDLQREDGPLPEFKLTAWRGPENKSWVLQFDYLPLTPDWETMLIVNDDGTIE